MRRMVAGMMCAVIGVVAVTAWGALTAAQIKKAQGLIAQCGDADFKLREEATRKLVEMGGDVLELVKQATREAQDIEVKTRCLMVVDALMEQEEVKRLEPSRVTLYVENQPLEEVLEEIARQSGNSVMRAQEGVSGRKVKVKMKDAGYWEAVNAVCAWAGACYEGTDRGTGVREIGVTPRRPQMVDVGAIAGPAMVIVGGVKRNASSYLDLHATGGKADANVLTFSMQVYLEDRLPMTNIALHLTSLTTADGVHHGPGIVQGQMATAYAGMGTGNIGGLWRQEAWWESPMEWPTGAARMEGTLEVSYGLHAKELRVEKVFETNGVEVEADGKALTVREVVRRDETATVTMALYDPANQVTGDMGQGARWGMFLVDPEGKRHGSKERFLNAQGKAVEARMTFTNLPNLRGDWTLIYAYPAKVAKASYPFTIEGVPLP